MRKLCTLTLSTVLRTVCCATDNLPLPTLPHRAGSVRLHQPSPTHQQLRELREWPGSVIPVQLMKTVDAKKAKAGDEVEARVTQDLKSGNGEFVVARDTKVVGHVTEAQARTKEQREPQIGIAFDHAVMKQGSDVSMPMSIPAIISPQPSNAASSGVDSNMGQQSPPLEPGGMPSARSSARDDGDWSGSAVSAKYPPGRQRACG
jgi:hypothetical protein